MWDLGLPLVVILCTYSFLKVLTNMGSSEAEGGVRDMIVLSTLKPVSRR